MAPGTIVAAGAGPSGPKIRSDLRVSFTPSGEDLDIRITSKVDYLYGEAIRKAVGRVVDAFGVRSGVLEIEDFGAVEWVIIARVECCLSRAGFNGPAVLPEQKPGQVIRPRRDRLRRSRLYVPGNQPKLMLSAGLYGADGIILDLEDSVPPAEKDAARILVRNALCAMDWGRSERMVRINQGELGQEDMEKLGPFSPEVILLPKVEDPEDVAVTAELLPEEDRPFLMPILESPLGIHRAFAIAAADDSVVALTLGLEDLSAELGAPRTEEGTESFLARQTTVYAARAAGVQPIASVYSDIRNTEGLAAYVRREAALGFDGIGCIHPRQIDVVHREMTPPEAAVERAVKIVRAAREAEQRGLGAVAVGSKMVDPPVVRQAFRTVQLAVAGGALDPEWDREES